MSTSNRLARRQCLKRLLNVVLALGAGTSFGCGGCGSREDRIPVPKPLPPGRFPKPKPAKN
jgi:hypothetical protein